MRNHIVDAFAKNPTRRLAFRDISNNLKADSMLVLRIYRFLDRWGIINRFDMEGAGYDPGNLELATRAGMAAILSTSKTPFDMGKTMELWIAGGRHSKTRLRPGTMQKYSVVPTGFCLPDASKAPFCASRPWVRCDGKHYAATNGDMLLCVDAYKNGEFPPGTSARDFALRDGPPAKLGEAYREGAGTGSAAPSKKTFSPQEDLLLLEAINKNWKKVEVVGSNGQPHIRSVYDWTAIAAAVSGRSESECVKRYLEYPIEESLLMAALDFDERFPLLTLGEDGSPSIPDRYRRAPYNSKDVPRAKGDINPLVGNLATILYVIGPEVASDAARHALESIVKQMDEAGASDSKDEKLEVDVKMEEAADQKQDTSGANPMRYGVDIQVLRNASFEAVSKAAVRAQEIAHERMMSMYSIILRMCDVQLERIWEKCDYLETLVGAEGGGEEAGLLHGRLHLEAMKSKTAT
jgi:SWI/SNF related-matrix-associated actin-dependent regulator of chromatin subfamily C